MKVNDVKKAYEAPALVELGGLHELTLIVKTGNICDTARCFHQSSVTGP
jgi:hypothetical protein